MLNHYECEDATQTNVQNTSTILSSLFFEYKYEYEHGTQPNVQNTFPCSLRLRSLDLCRYDELVAQGIDLEQETTDDTTDTEGTAASATVAVETKEDGDKAERAESDRLRSSSTTSNSRQLSTASTTAGGLVEEEERSTGDVDSKAYWHYLYSMGWG